MDSTASIPRCPDIARLPPSRLPGGAIGTPARTAEGRGECRSDMVTIWIIEPPVMNGGMASRTQHDQRHPMPLGLSILCPLQATSAPSVWTSTGICGIDRQASTTKRDTLRPFGEKRDRISDCAEDVRLVAQPREPWCEG